jgi:hypothetical protein
MEAARPTPRTAVQAECLHGFAEPAVVRCREGDRAGAVDTGFRGVFGPDYRGAFEDGMPGAFEQAVADADAFFRQELPALPVRLTPAARGTGTAAGATTMHPAAAGVREPRNQAVVPRRKRSPRARRAKRPLRTRSRRSATRDRRRAAPASVKSSDSRTTPIHAPRRSRGRAAAASSCPCFHRGNDGVMGRRLGNRCGRPTTVSSSGATTRSLSRARRSATRIVLARLQLTPTADFDDQRE